MAGFTAERDMGTEGAGSADTAVRDAIDKGLIPGPRLRISGNAIDILGGHEDANHFNPAQHVLSNATYANSRGRDHCRDPRAAQAGSDFVKIYETGAMSMRGGVLHTPYQYSRASCRPPSTRPREWAATVAVHADGRTRHAVCGAGRRGFDRPRDRS